MLWIVFALVAAVAVPAVVAAVDRLRAVRSGVAVAGSAHPSQWIDTDGLRKGVRRVPDRATIPQGAGHAALVTATVADLETFWTSTLPEISDEDFVPLRGGLTAVDSAAPTGSAPCVSQPSQIIGNAYYCPAEDGIVYDSGALVPVLLDNYGIAGLVSTFAHEFGHAIQARIGPTPAQQSDDPARYPALLVELQGDCDAGAFLAWAAAGHAPHVHLDTPAVLAGINALLDFSDPVTLRPSDPTAHGLALDRLTALGTGYREGAAACHAMTMESAQPTLGRVPVPRGGVQTLSAPRYPTVDAVQDAARGSLQRFTGDPVTAVADDAALAGAARYGQFAQAAVLAYAVGTARYPEAAADGAASCFVGAWAASVWGHAPSDALGGWPGDADEALAVVRHRPDATIDDLLGYADGFHRGVRVCGST